MRVDVFHHFDENQLTRIERKLDALAHQENIIMADLTALTAEVAETTAVEQSAITLIQGIAAQLAAAATDPAAVQALADQLSSGAAGLAAAVAANTPPPAA
jgi:hypothetical protein